MIIRAMNIHQPDKIPNVHALKNEMEKIKTDKHICGLFQIH